MLFLEEGFTFLRNFLTDVFGMFMFVGRGDSP
jgi:hypothetical protein